MSDVPADLPPPIARPWRAGWANRLIASRKFQSWASRFPLTRRLVRKEGEALFDLIAGFCHSQVLMALVRLDVLDMLSDRPQSLRHLAMRCQVPEDRMRVLMNAAVALGLVKRKGSERFGLTRTGAALLGVPGLPAMISHHDVLYRDLVDPVAFFRGEVDTELAGFWPYVFGGEMDRDVAKTYSDLMADSQVLVAEDTLRTVSFAGIETLMDVGGGTGAFLSAVGAAHPAISLRLFDLPEVAPGAERRFEKAGLATRAEIRSGSFRTDNLPEGADAISLVRVLYDHDDATVRELLSSCYAALPAGGQLIISEPMSGGARPTRAGDAYFALYTMAMRTGRSRSAAEISGLLSEVGFAEVTCLKAPRPYITGCITAKKDSH